MTVAALRTELEREEALLGLTLMRRAKLWERWDIAEPLVTAHLPVGTMIRLPASLMPDWYRALWFDPTQLDGRVMVGAMTQWFLRMKGVSPGRLILDMDLTVNTEWFLDAVLAGLVGDSS